MADQTQQNPKVLFLRSSSQAIPTSHIAEGLYHLSTIELEQYPPVLPDNWLNIDRLYDPKGAYKALSYNVVSKRKEVRDKLVGGYYDLVVLFDWDGQLFSFNNMSLLEKLRNWLGQFKHVFRLSLPQIFQQIQYMRGSPLSIRKMNAIVPVVAVDLDDWNCLPKPSQTILNEVLVYFKRELPYNRYYLYYQDRPAPWWIWREKVKPLLENVQNISLGIEDRKYFEMKKKRNLIKDIDIFYCCGDTSTQRSRCNSHLEKMAAETTWNIKIASDITFDEYCETMARSKITLSLSGGGWDCYRHYEAVALGSLPVMDRPTGETLWWQEFADEIFFDNSFENFQGRLYTLLNNNEHRGKCLKRLENHVESHLLHSKIAEYIVFSSLDKASGYNTFYRKNG